VEYIVITLLAIAATTFLVYLLANKVFAVRLRLKSLVLCAICALILSLVLPRIVVSFVGLAGTVGFLALFAVIFAYFVAYYDEPKDLQPAGTPSPANINNLENELPPAADASPACATASGFADRKDEPSLRIAADSATDVQETSAPVYAAAADETEEAATVVDDILQSAPEIAEPSAADSEVVALDDESAADEQLGQTTDDTLEQVDSESILDPLAGLVFADASEETADGQEEAESETQAPALLADEENEPPVSLAAELESEPTGESDLTVPTQPEPQSLSEQSEKQTAELEPSEADAEPEPTVVPELGLLLGSFTAAAESEAIDAEQVADSEPEPIPQADTEKTPEPEPMTAAAAGEAEAAPEAENEAKTETVAEPDQDTKSLTTPEPEIVLEGEPEEASADEPEAIAAASVDSVPETGTETAEKASAAKPEQDTDSPATEVPDVIPAAEIETDSAAMDDQAAGLEMEIELNLIAGPVAGSEIEQDDEEAIPLPSSAASEVEPACEPLIDETASGLEAEAESLATLALAGADEAAAGPLAETNLAQHESPKPEGEGSEAAAADDEPLAEESEVTAIAEPVSDSLDDLLDFAFNQKDQGNLTLALDTFRRAFKLYRESEAGPLLVIEIAGLLKAKGAYDEAVVFLSDGRSLSALQHNQLLDQEFVNTIAYLRIVKNTLMQNRIGFVPFQRIPDEIAKEIDEEFREWRNLA
jgi:hypothetical protein